MLISYVTGCGYYIDEIYRYIDHCAYSSDVLYEIQMFTPRRELAKHFSGINDMMNQMQAENIKDYEVVIVHNKIDK